MPWDTGQLFATGWTGFAVGDGNGDRDRRDTLRYPALRCYAAGSFPVSVSQFQTLFNAFEALLVMVKPLTHYGHIAVDQCQVAAQACDVFFERAHTHCQDIDLCGQRTDAAAYVAQVIEDQILDILHHGHVTLADHSPARERPVRQTPLAGPLAWQQSICYY